jgi:glycosyltransferase involved in cell wall biosynthesis
VDAYITLTEFSREVFVRGDLPDHKLVVKPNFVPSSTLGHGLRRPQVVFAGSMTRSKGLQLLLEAWSIADLGGFDLLLVGDGPERNCLEQQFSQLPRARWCGRVSRSEVLNYIATSRMLVFPTLAYENCPMVLLEALSVGTPVVAANHAGLATIIRHRREGVLFHSGSSQALAAALRDACLADQETWSNWSSAARRAHAERYSEELSYRQLISIYHRVTQSNSAPAAHAQVVMESSR